MFTKSTHVRTARPLKVDILRKEYGSGVEVFPIADITSGDYTEALEGLYNALINAHTTS